MATRIFIVRCFEVIYEKLKAKSCQAKNEMTQNLRKRQDDLRLVCHHWYKFGARLLPERLL